MKKGLKITIIVIPILLAIVVSSFVGTLLYTQKNITYEVGDTTISNYISQSTISYFPPTYGYTGYILTKTPFEITNNGLYKIENLVISVKVYGQNFSITSLNNKLLGQGENSLGNILKGESWFGNLEINMTLDIALLAISDGELRVEAEINLYLNFLIYKAPVITTDTQIKPWNSPF